MCSWLSYCLRFSQPFSSSHRNRARGPLDSSLWPQVPIASFMCPGKSLCPAPADCPSLPTIVCWNGKSLLNWYQKVCLAHRWLVLLTSSPIPPLLTLHLLNKQIKSYSHKTCFFHLRILSCAIYVTGSTVLPCLSPLYWDTFTLPFFLFCFLPF